MCSQPSRLPHCSSRESCGSDSWASGRRLWVACRHSSGLAAPCVRRESQIAAWGSCHAPSVVVRSPLWVSRHVCCAVRGWVRQLNCALSPLSRVGRGVRDGSVMESGVLSTRNTGFLDVAVFYRGELFLRAVESRSGCCFRGVCRSVRPTGYQWRFASRGGAARAHCCLSMVDGWRPRIRREVPTLFHVKPRCPTRPLTLQSGTGWRRALLHAWVWLRRLTSEREGSSCGWAIVLR